MPKHFLLNKEIIQNKNNIFNHKFIMEFFAKRKNPVSYKELFKEFCFQNKNNFKYLLRILNHMTRKGHLLCIRHKYYIMPKFFNLTRGKVIGHRDGYGFLRVKGKKDDFYLSNKQMKFCIHGDLVLAQLIDTDRKGRKEAIVIRVKKSRNKMIVGRYFYRSSIGFVIPYDDRLNFNIIVPLRFNLCASNNCVVVVELLHRPTVSNKATGKIIEILGKDMVTSLAINIAIRNHELPYKWSPEIMLQLNKLNHQLTEEVKIGRVDLRKLPLITIDDEDARDFDDAIYCKKLNGNGWRLWVAIADVSYYVRPGTPIDKEAYSRGTSVYFPSKVIPMLPEIISNELCSLNPKVDCLCMVCEMDISSQGKLVGFKHYEAIMNSHARLTYNEAWKILQDNCKLHDKYILLKSILNDLYNLYKVLEKARQDRGSISFETSETKFIFNNKNRVERIERIFRNDVHKIVEECMIMANFASANFVEKNKEPILFRDHDCPTNDKIKNFNAILNELGIILPKFNYLKPVDYSLMMMNLSKRPDYEILQTIFLRSMKQASYDPQNRGHFALALSSYTHFTSPIRRYPDLLLHRVIKYLLSKKEITTTKNLFTDNGGYRYNIKEIDKLGCHCSLTERRAEEATRDVSDWLKCDLMKNQVGKIFDGIIFSITNYGLFVRLSEFFVEGLIHISTLKKECYKYDSICQRLIGETSGYIYHLGDAVKVYITAVHVDERRIYFELVANNKTLKYKN
ncbi:ribonuclease R [Candidatus Pantoea edessiphila]|nr:ribonuclease R [Candidatus Pantoea edessiphila]